jgi:hypothetical protein
MTAIPLTIERRGDTRFRVEHLEIEIDGERLTILDIGPGSVRLERPVRAALDRKEIPFVFVGIADGERVPTYGVIVRQTDNCIVLAYAQPCLDWEARLTAYANLAFGKARLRVAG